jgi:hypothetical protein
VNRQSSLTIAPTALATAVFKVGADFPAIGALIVAAAVSS